MEKDGAIVSPLRLLILEPTRESPSSRPPLVAPFLEKLTGAAPPEELFQDGGTFAGYTSHPPLKLRTKYYSVDVGIWCDEIPLPNSTKPSVLVTGPEDQGPPLNDAALTLTAWKQQMLSTTALEVRAAIGAMVLILPYSTSLSPQQQTHSSHDDGPRQSSALWDSHLELLETVNELRETIEDENFGREIATIAVLQRQPTKLGPTLDQQALDAAAEQMEELWLDTRGALGIEFVAWESGQGGQTNSTQEELEMKDNRERSGVAKAVEALELVNWNASDDEGDGNEAVSSFLNDDDLCMLPTGADEDGIEMQSQELEREMLGLKMAIHELDESDNEVEDQNVGVEQLQRMMDRVVAIREAGAEMSKEERERFARREVERLMKDVG